MKRKTSLQTAKEKAVRLAMDLYVRAHPKCELCGKKASTAHHVIRQSRSNYLRTEPRNLVSICRSCHYKLHLGSEPIYMGMLIEKRGLAWIKQLQKESRITIHDTVGYWKTKYGELSRESYPQ